MRISDWSSDVCSSDLDNVFFTHVGFSWLDFVDLDHVELVRGPPGTLLGKNTTIGALVVTTKKPSFDPGLELEDRQSVVEGKSVSVRVDLGGRAIIQKKK